VNSLKPEKESDMATQFEIDCALMAGRAYQTTRGKINWFPVPVTDGWTEFFHVPNSDYPISSGFEAVYFQRGNEIVISFAGTYKYDFAHEWLADLQLGLGNYNAQLLKAAKYYLEIKKNNPNAIITFTGHSLGGGLAALMGVLFDEKAVTFDQAPFLASATEEMRNRIRVELLLLKDQNNQKDKWDVLQK